MEGEHNPRQSPILQEGQIFLRHLTHDGLKTKVQNMGRHASEEGREGLDGVGRRNP